MSLYDPFAFISPGKMPTPRPLDWPALGKVPVDFDALYDMGAVALEPVPETERGQYRHWRGAHVAKIAMNFSRGIPVLNAGYDNVLHFIDNYTYAFNTANGLTRKTQMSDADRLELSKFTGRDPEAPMPGIVLALDTPDNEMNLLPSEDGNQRGGIIYRRLTLEMIDPHSREMLQGLLGVTEG